LAAPFARKGGKNVGEKKKTQGKCKEKLGQKIERRQAGKNGKLWHPRDAR